MIVGVGLLCGCVAAEREVSAVRDCADAASGVLRAGPVNLRQLSSGVGVPRRRRVSSYCRSGIAVADAVSCGVARGTCSEGGAVDGRVQCRFAVKVLGSGVIARVVVMLGRWHQATTSGIVSNMSSQQLTRFVVGLGVGVRACHYCQCDTGVLATCCCTSDIKALVLDQYLNASASAETNSSAVSTFGPCATGYAGVQCSQCASGYYRLNNACSQCES